MATAYLGRGLLGVADVENAIAISAQYPASTVHSIRTSGYAATGFGSGVYASDSLATATLAAEHPRFCKQSLDGRYWRLLPEASGFISVMQGGATGDGATNDYAAIQATIDYAQSFGGATIYFPAGTYWVETTPEIAHGQGMNLRGEGADRSIISAGAMAAMKTRGLWRSRIEGLAFWCNNNTSGGAFELDGEPDGSFGAQGNTFINCQFFGNYNSKHAFTLCRVSGGNGMGSENTWISCAFLGAANESDAALFLVAGGNALQNTLLGCNFQSFVTGVKIYSGNVDILHCGFQSTYGYDQIAHGGWDVDASASTQGDTVTMTGCRTESLRIYQGGGSPAQISGFGYAPAAIGSNWAASWEVSENQLISRFTAAGNWKAYRVTTAGTTGGSAPVWPESGTVSDGSAVWTQLDYDVFHGVQGTIAMGTVNYGQIHTAAGQSQVDLRNIQFTREDAVVTAYYDTGPGPLVSNCFFYNIPAGHYSPLKINLRDQFGMNPAAGTDRTATFNIGNRTIVATQHDTSTGAPGYDLEIGPDAADGSNEVGNYWGVRGGWGFGQITFADVASISRNGVVFYVTDGTPGSDPLTGGGTGCLAVRQNGLWRALSMGSGSGSPPDGDKGDIVVSGSGTAWAIDNGAVSLSKMADVGSGTLFYRKTAGAGAPEVQTLATLKSDLGLTGTNTGDQTSVSGNAGTATALQTSRNFSISGAGITAASVAFNGTGAVVLSASVDAGHITLARMADVATGAIFYRKTAGTGAPEVQSLATLKTDLGLSGTNSGDQTTISGNAGSATVLQTSRNFSISGGGVTATAVGFDGSASVVLNASVDAGHITLARMANLAANSFIGNNTGSAATPLALTGPQATALLDTFTSATKGLAPASGGGTTNFLRADGNWAAPAGGGGSGDVVGPASATDNSIARFDLATGKLIQSSQVSIDDSGNIDTPGFIRHASIATPAAPSGGILLYSGNVAGRHMARVIAPVGIDTALQAGLHGNSIFMLTPSQAAGPPNLFGATLTTAGTISSSQTIASANPWQATQRKRFQTAATAAAGAGMRTAYSQWFRGSAAGFGGFFFRTQFGQNLNVNGAQCFVGLCASTAVLGTGAGTVAALVNMIGVGFDTTDANTGNWQLFRNDGTGTATKVDLGSGAARNTTHGYDLIIFCPPGAASTIYVKITNIHTGSVVLDTSYTTDIPAADTGLAFKAECNNGAVASAQNIEVAKVYIESDY